MRPIEKWRNGTNYLQRPNASSWRRAHQTVSTFHQPCHNQSTASSMRTTQPHYNRIFPWPQQGTISTSQCPSAKPSSRATFWQYPSQILPPGCPPSYVWRLLGNYPVFTTLMVIYHYVEIIGEFLLPSIFSCNIYNHENIYPCEPVNIYIQLLIMIIQENNRLIATKKG